jgi:hypothetical protein
MEQLTAPEQKMLDSAKKAAEDATQWSRTCHAIAADMLKDFAESCITRRVGDRMKAFKDTIDIMCAMSREINW